MDELSFHGAFRGASGGASIHAASFAASGRCAARLELGGAARSARTADRRARFMTGGGYRLLASANFGGLALGCINADFCNEILS